MTLNRQAIWSGRPDSCSISGIAQDSGYRYGVPGLAV